MTVTSTARVSTERPGRYGKQLASHMSKKLDTEWDADAGRGHISFDGDLQGELEMISGDNVLLLQLQAKEGQLDALEDVVGRHLVRFGAKDELVCSWVRQGGAQGTTQTNDEE